MSSDMSVAFLGPGVDKARYVYGMSWNTVGGIWDWEKK